jgi:hypothetical protein
MNASSESGVCPTEISISVSLILVINTKKKRNKKCSFGISEKDS